MFIGLLGLIGLSDNLFPQTAFHLLPSAPSPTAPVTSSRESVELFFACAWNDYIRICFHRQ
jgi:hypothetical protein